VRVLQLVLEAERGQRILRLGVQLTQLVEIEEASEFPVIAESDQVVQFARQGERLDDGEQLVAILDNADLLREQFGIVQRVIE